MSGGFGQGFKLKVLNLEGVLWFIFEQQAVFIRAHDLSAIASDEGMYFEEATFDLGSDVQTR